jgi:cytochrome oxidase Cu insertion factor (SCO1/SenC/PrrC family)
MHVRKYTFLFLVVLMPILAACAPIASSGATMTSEPTEAMGHEDDMMDTPMATNDMMDTTEMPGDMMGTPEATNDMMDATEAIGGMVENPAWFGDTLTNAASGETFTISSFEGKVVLVENMAQWCPTCLQQQKQVLQLHQMLGDQAKLVSLALDVDPNEDAPSLKAYIEKNGFDWTYAIAPAELSSALSKDLGDQFLNPPSAPMFIIDSHGGIHPLPFGVKSADDLLAALKPFLDEAM